MKTPEKESVPVKESPVARQIFSTEESPQEMKTPSALGTPLGRESVTPGMEPSSKKSERM